MKRTAIVQIIKKEKLVVVIRLKQQKDISEVIRALITGGVQVLEITSNTPGYLDAIAAARKQHPNILVGAGTVINSEIAIAAIAAGAQFLVTPNTDVKVVQTAHENNVPVLMGALTPTEVCNAVSAGADLVKLFPIAHMGVNYFKGIKGPLSNVDFFAVGGISLDNIQEWKDAGVSGFGLGGNLVKPIRNLEDFNSIVSSATKTIKIIQA